MRTEPNMNESQWIGAIVGGHYEIVELLNEGGHSQLFLARNLVNGGADAAIKVVRQDATDPFLSDRLNREGTVLALLKGQPACPTLLTRRFTPDGQLMLVVELLDGMTLQSMLERGERRIELDEVMNLFPPAIQTLAVLHQRGIVHRNIHPGKLFRSWDPPGLKLTGFGDAHSVLHGTGNEHFRLFGQPKYTSPEVWLGKGDLDARCDVYSMAVVLYRCLAGRCPFEQDSAVALIGESPQQTVPPLSQLVPGLPPALDDWATIALCHDRDGRFDNIEAMWSAFIRAGQSASQPEDAPAEQLQTG